MVPRKRPRQYREVMKGPKFNPTIRTPTNARDNTKNHADLTERSPAAIGKKGLFTLQLKPTIWKNHRHKQGVSCNAGGKQNISARIMAKRMIE